MKIKTVKRQLGLFLVNHFFASTGAFGAKRSLLRFAGHLISEKEQKLSDLSFAVPKFISEITAG